MLSSTFIVISALTLAKASVVSIPSTFVTSDVTHLYHNELDCKLHSSRCDLVLTPYSAYGL